jgi:hypothetical protein
MKPVKSALVLVSAYLFLALLITAVWTWCARTEITKGATVIVGPRGERYSSRFNGIVDLVEGRSMAPFARRRLLPDLTRLLVRLTPVELWPALERRIEGDCVLAGLVRSQLARLEWRPERYPVLFTATFLIGCSVLGFLFACRRLVTLVYDIPSWLAGVLGGVLGLALLGGNGDWHYLGYPYDFPNAFVFTLALVGLLSGRRWFVPVFALAAYSKETSVLLILAYVLMAHDRRSLRFWVTLALLVAVYAAIRGAIALNCTAMDGDFWWPRRNAHYLALRVFYVWWLPFLGVSMVRLVALWRHYPPELRRLCLLAVPLLGLAFFKGWIEEMRQYLELMPIVGLIVIQWTLHEAGLGHLLRARHAAEQVGPAAAGRESGGPLAA